MSSFEQLFSSAQLNVLVPDTSIEFPSPDATDEWLSQLQVDQIERKQAFFDERLHFMLLIRIPSDDITEKQKPPQELLGFLSHLQISLEATYISPLPTVAPGSSPNRLSAPPRSDSIAKTKARTSLTPHPSIFPPHTPNPTPATAENDRKYVQSEGTMLLASIWGQHATENLKEAFSLLRSEKEKCWVAVYGLTVSVAFLRLNVSDPLLCLTVSATLREKAVLMTHPKHPLAEYLASVGGLPDPTSPISSTANGAAPSDATHEDSDFVGFEEVNLLEGLSSGPNFTTRGPDAVLLPSTRLGSKARREIFSLDPVAPSTPAPVQTPTSATPRGSHPTLRKSFRKTLQTVSGFRVRMRTVFVPYVLLPEHADTDAEPEGEEAGNEERTVVLCVEIENSGESGPSVGFVVEGVDVHIGGEGAKATLIGWGDGGFGKGVEEKVFPLCISAMEQYNLLYAVSFLRSPDDADALTGIATAGDSSEMQRAVTININGKPFLRPDTEHVTYPTHTFSSRWNCVLDLSSAQPPRPERIEVSEYPDVLPEPPSPFPMTSPHTATFTNTPMSASDRLQAVAGSKRHTHPALSGRTPTSATTPSNYRASTSMLNPANSRHMRTDTPPVSARTSYTPPSIAVQSYLRSPTTYGPPPSAGIEGEDVFVDGGYQHPPQTPAYPAYSPHSALPPTPHSQMPISHHQTGSLGPSVEIRRERAASGVGIPQTPGPMVGGVGFGDGGFGQSLQRALARDRGQPIVVSVGLLPTARKGKGSEVEALGSGKIYPLDEFTLDVFVFNKSARTRRLEVTYPDRRRRRREQVDGSGILPLDNRVRIGPLRPSTCQSVRMGFLAIAPGVHTIDTLTLTDVESGFSMNLRSVLDIVVHEPVGE